MVAQLPSQVCFFATSRTAAGKVSLSLTISRSLLKIMSISSAMPSSHPSSDALFSFCHQSFPASGTFSMSQLFASDDQNTGVSASASVLPMNIQDWFPLRLTYLIFLAVQGTFRSLLQHHSLKASILKHSTFFTIQLLQPYMTTGKL